MATVIDAIIKLQDQMSDKLAKVNEGLKKTDRMAKETSKSIANTGKAFNSAADLMKPFATVAIATASASIAAYSEFDTKYHAFLNKLEGDTKNSTDIAQDAFYKMGTRVAVSTDKLVDMANAIGGSIAGLTGKEIMDMTEAVSKFAVATDTDATVAASMFTNTMNAFKLEASQVPHVLDAITAASNYSSADVADLGEALTKTSASASAMNQSLDVTLGALAVLADSGVRGSEAGTGLSNIFERMAKDSNRAVLENMGIAIKDSAGNMRSLIDIAQDFETKTQGMSGMDKQGLALQAFGDVGGRAFIKLSQNIDSYKEKTNGIINSTNAMNDAYAEMQKSLGGSLQIAKNNGMAILYKIGEKLAPKVKELVDRFTEFTNKVLDANDGTLDMVITLGEIAIAFFGVTRGIGMTLTAVSKIRTGFQTTMTIIRAVGSAIKFFGNGIGAIGRVLATIGRGIMTFGGIVGKFLTVIARGVMLVGRALIANPIGAIIMAIVVVLYLLYENWDTVKVYLIAGWNMLRNAINAVVNWFNGTLVPAWNDGINAIANFFTGLWEGIKSGVSGAVSFIKDAINTIISALNSVSFSIPSWVPGFGGQDFSLNIPLLFTGAENWKGGLAAIHDQGGEIVDLPSGTRVMPHDKSVKEAREMGRKEGSASKVGNSINIAKLADSIVVREEADINRIISGLVDRLQTHAINTMEGAV